MSPVGSMKPSPEERLLALIRGKGKSAAQTSGQPEAAASIAAALPAKKPSQPLQWMQLVVGGLGVFLLAEASFIVYELAQPLPAVSMPAPVLSTKAAAPPEPLRDVPSLASSLSRPLFGVSSSSGMAMASVGNDSIPSQRLGPSELAKKLVSRLTLTGIVAGESPQAVIEDNETKKTYFVTVGQAVAEGAVLDQVLDNRVILDLGGEKISLSL